MKIRLSFLLALPFILSAQVKSPQEFLGYELGDKFTRHHRVVDYFNHVAQGSANVNLIEYGKTYEDRPLLLAFISTEENIARLEEIKEDNLKRAGIQEGAPDGKVSIIWLSYNVHGNESSSTEASMATIYELVKEGSDKSDWLKNTVVVIDPCINPDGRDRYANFFWQYGNQPYNPDPNSMEHNEPWPGGRANHYLFDLNRDWAWQSQIESQSRIKVYNQWLPQIHVDFHEQGINSPYYFAPAAQPFHELITQFQRDFQTEIGRNNARYFDENNWFYFTKQFFDLLYPSYGDTYPTYNGAIGMTYEQAGHGRAGLGIIKQEGDSLTLKDRIAHHYTTGLSTIEISSKNSDRLLSEFGKFFGNNSSLKYKTFVLKHDGNEDKFNALKTWLDVQGIEYGSASNSKGLRGYNYSTGQNSGFTIGSKDMVINMDQPKATLAHILMEPKTTLVDSVTYDITAWGVPYAYGIQAYATEQLIPVQPTQAETFAPQQTPARAYAFVAKWNSMDDAVFLANLLKENIKVRFTERVMNHKGTSFDRGSLIIAKRDNKQLGTNFEKEIVRLANESERKLTAVGTGFMDGGPDIGSSDVRYLKRPKIALLAGDGTSSLAFGATWHFMEQELKYPLTVLGTDYFGRVDLSEYDVIIMQDGWYSTFKEQEMKKLMEWVSSGGKLIAVEGALGKLKDSDYSSLSEYNSEDDKKEGEKKEEERDEKAQLVRYEDQERESIKSFAPGAIYRVKVDNSNPLAFGYNSYYTLKTSSDKVSYLEGGNAGIIENENDILSGFAGQYAREDMAKTLVFGVEGKGRGQIVHIVDNPLFRSFWHNGKLMFVNALFFVGQ
ncbi:MAG: M14 family metallopeptidase [Cyclobacteriaceae bacterium]